MLLLPYNLFEMRALLFLSLLCIAVQANNAMTYTFPFADAPNRYYTPAYDLGFLTLNYSITISITIPNAGSSSQLAGLVSALTLKFVDSTMTVPALVGAVVIGGAPFVFPPATSLTFYSVNYTVSFPSSFTPPMANFILSVSDSAAIAALKLDYYNLQVRSYPTSQGQSVGNQGSVSTLIKVTDIIRADIAKVIYVAQSNFIYSFTLFPASYSLPSSINVLDTYRPKLYRIHLPNENSDGFNGNDFPLTAYGGTIDSVERIKATVSGTQANYYSNIGHYQINIIQPGFYLLELQVLQQPIFTGSITFSTDPYACPFSPSYQDYYLSFQGCSAPSSPLGAPCIGYNPITQRCALCIPGYTLIDGACFANTDCPDRQYYHYGTCYAVSSSCGRYDRFTGDCLSCATDNLVLVNGSCIQRYISCGNRQWRMNGNCLDVSPDCDSFDPNTGKCLTCVQPLQLNPNGTCSLVIVCGPNQYYVNSTCLPIPAICVRFDTLAGVCLQCVPSYYVQAGQCQQIQCPSGQVPSRYSVTCVDVSPLCDQYDPVFGDCLTCKYSGYTVRDGACVQVVSPLAGCREREALGFGSCVGADINCKTFNLVTGDCDVCLSGYYIDYTGKCNLNANCSSGQWSVNGECLTAPNNCQTLDQLGFCAVCMKGYRLVDGQCIFFQQCGPHEYLNGAVCTPVSGSCATWNPSTGVCITCKTAGTFPTNGVCCPPGQIFSGDSCVSTIAIKRIAQGSDSPACLIRHPSLNFCLQCAEGYTPDYSIPFACTPQ